MGVVGVNRVTLKKEGKVIPTNTLFMAFGSLDLLKEITVGYLKVKVALFVPNPMRCFNCNKFGHTSQRCKVAAKCPDCGKDKHEGRCEGPKLCSNCSNVGWVRSVGVYVGEGVVLVGGLEGYLFCCDNLYYEFYFLGRFFGGGAGGGGEGGGIYSSMSYNQFKCI